MAFLTEVTVDWRRNDLPTDHLPSRDASAPTYSELLSRRQIQDDWSRFLAKELFTVDYLREVLRFPSIVSVDTMHGRYRSSSPDAAMPQLGVTFEIKRLRTGTFSGVQSAFDRARKQARRVVIETRGTKMLEVTAVRAVRQALLRTGGNFDEVLVIGEDWGILWP